MPVRHLYTVTLLRRAQDSLPLVLTLHARECLLTPVNAHVFNVCRGRLLGTHQGSDGKAYAHWERYVMMDTVLSHPHRMLFFISHMLCIVSCLCRK